MLFVMLLNHSRRKIMVQITDSEIQIVEKILLPDSCTFNEERVDFIRCMKSRDVVACPGSGKTTALLAKILVLASNMPFQDGRGICVLTHTNVAIDKIKTRLGANAEHLFRSPNFFGTIQSFVNRFLAIPLYRNEFGQAQHSIDVKIFNSTIERLYGRTQKAQYRLSNFYGDNVSDIGFLWVSPKDLTVKEALRKKFSKLNMTEKSFEEVVSIRSQLLKEGILSYQDAYSLALRYLQNYPSVITAMRNRFKFVFLDETQDTDLHQFEVINQLFLDTNDVILQRLGDPNQAIFSKRVKKDMVWVPIKNPIHFSDTKRFGKTITKILHAIRIDNQISLKENLSQKSLPPYIITYTKKNIENVLPAFARLIHSNSLHKDHAIKEPTFKAIGWIGKDKTKENKLCLRHYFPNYHKSIKTRKDYFSNLLSYLSLASTRELKTKGAKVYKDAILQGIVHAFYLGELKNPENAHRFTSNSFSKWFRENNEPAYLLFIAHLSKWMMLLHRREQTPIQIRDKIAMVIRNQKDIQITDELKSFLTSDTIEFSEEEQRASNTFTSDGGISIEVGTVHSVKGETHTATLYLETYYQRKTDSQRLLEFLKGNYLKNERKKTYHIENLKIAHVAFSRPTHLLAFACNEDNIKASETNLKNNGWKIESVEDLLRSCK